MLKPSDLIKSGWCKCRFACDKDSNTCSEMDERAAYWCVVGALDRVFTINQKRNDMVQLLCTLIPERPLFEDGVDFVAHLTAWNDDARRTKEDVIALLESAGL